tara:strand:+ start:7865 stop:8554 length:690 start_codon:yes stop_codon:yes gene_type:complete
MPQSINKKKIYFYLLILIFLSTSFNINIFSDFSKINLIKNIEIQGLENKEKNLLIKELEILKNNNIFFIDKKKISKILNLFDFLDYYNIKKIIPSKLIVTAKKTNFVGSTIIDGKNYYVGKNGKFISEFDVQKESNLPLIFGNFKPNEFLDLQNNLVKENFKLNKIKKYFFYKNQRWDFQDHQNNLVMLPSKNVVQSLKIYKKIIEYNKFDTAKIIDLRIPNKIILTYE